MFFQPRQETGQHNISATDTALCTAGGGEQQRAGGRVQLAHGDPGRGGDGGGRRQQHGQQRGQRGEHAVQPEHEPGGGRGQLAADGRQPLLGVQEEGGPAGHQVPVRLHLLLEAPLLGPAQLPV